MRALSVVCHVVGAGVVTAVLLVAGVYVLAQYACRDLDFHIEEF